MAAGLLEALRSARMKAALVPLILRRNGVPLETLPSSTDFLHTAGGRIADAYRLIDEHLDDRQSVQLIAGPRGLFRLHVRGGRITSAEAGPRRPTAADTDRLAADARDAFAELARVRDVTLEARLR